MIRKGLRVCEIFESIQGEGLYAGHPVLFIRLSGCTRNCKYCDTKYHKNYKTYTPKMLCKIINKSKMDIVVWTGGEPLKQFKEIKNVIHLTRYKKHHLETNGDLIKILDKDYNFDFICISPKDLKHIKEIMKFLSNIFRNVCIKVVTDLKMNKELISYADMLMPLTTYNSKKDKEIEQKVWNYCVQNNKRFCLRQHVKVFGKRRKI